MSWREKYSHELNLARNARASGNEGKARVCSRRAAAIILEEFFRQKGTKINLTSALDVLRYASQSPLLDQYWQELVDHFLLKVSEDFTLPPEIDLISDAETIRELLRPE